MIDFSVDNADVKTLNIGGLVVTLNEASVLYHLAKQCRKGVIVEIGSWKGYSTAWLALGSKAGGQARVYAIDPFTGIGVTDNPTWGVAESPTWTYPDFLENMKFAEVDDIVSPIVALSEEAAKDFNELVELLFIDGDHTYEKVRLDFALWSPKIIPHGHIALHDTYAWHPYLAQVLGHVYPGPARVVKEYLENSSIFKILGLVDSMTYARKVEEHGDDNL